MRFPSMNATRLFENRCLSRLKDRIFHALRGARGDAFDHEFAGERMERFKGVSAWHGPWARFGHS